MLADIDEDETITEINSRIYECEGYSEDIHRLLVLGRELDDKKTVSDYNLHLFDDNIIYLYFKKDK